METSADFKEALDHETEQDMKTEVSTISLQARIPHFWRENPRLWFAQFEAVVAPYKTSDENKYNLVIPALDRTDIEQISDIIISPPSSGKYTALKRRLISVYQESEHRQIQKLLGGLELGEQKPTQLLRRMRELGGSAFPDETLKVIWMNQIPVQIRAVLSVNTESSLDGLAAMADKMMEHSEDSSIAVLTATMPSTSVNNAQYEVLAKQLEKLTLEIAELRVRQEDGRSRNYRRPFRSRSRSRSRALSRNRKPGDSDWQCRYHYRFGDKARRCESPCVRRKQKQEN